MTIHQAKADPVSCRFLTTEQLASVLHLRPQSIRKRYMVTGSYHGVRPVKLPNRYLAWPTDAVEQLLSGGR